MPDTIDTAEIRADYGITAENRERLCEVSQDVNGLCDEIDALRGLVAEYRAESNETWTAIRADRDALRAKVAAVEKLHAPSEVIYADVRYCLACTDWDSNFGGSIWPCETVAAISGPVER